MKYRVHPSLIPQDVAQRRQPYPKDGQISDDQLIKLDDKYAFYNVFIDSGKGEGEIVAFGPPALNLKSFVKKLQVFVNGKEKKFSLADYPEQKVSILKASLSRQKRYDVVFKFPGSSMMFFWRMSF